MQKKRIYLDYAASTPVDPRVMAMMKPYWNGRFGNPGSLHSFGQEAITAVDKSREEIALSIGADFREVLFTASATEANNLALRGVVHRWKFGDRSLRQHTRNVYPHTRSSTSDLRSPHSEPRRIIVSAIEHESVLETARVLTREGVEVVVVPVTKEGIVDLKKLKAAVNERTILVSIMYANNETGAIQPIAEISNIIKDVRSSPRTRYLPPVTYPLFHTDAAQAFQFLDCNVHTLGVDLMTLSAHKLYGPKGIGALYVKGFSPQDMKSQAALKPNAYFLSSIITGGGQEFGMRSGTENVPLIVGFAAAVRYIVQGKEGHARRLAELRTHLLKGLKKIYPKLLAHGLRENKVIPNMVNVYLPGVEGQDMLIRLDRHGVAISSGSACSARSLEASPVLLAMGYSKDHARASVRISLGRPTTKKEIDRVLNIIRK